QVEHHDVRAEPGGATQRLGTGVRGDRLPALVAGDGGDQVGDGRIVVHDEQAYVVHPLILRHPAPPAAGPGGLLADIDSNPTGTPARGRRGTDRDQGVSDGRGWAGGGMARVARTRDPRAPACCRWRSPGSVVWISPAPASPA